MPNLKSLTFCPAPQQLAGNPRLVRRQRLIDRLEEQRRLAKDPSYEVVVKRTSKDADGNRVVKEHRRRVRPWWKTDEQGNAVLIIRNGFKVLEFEKGKPGVAVGSLEKLPEVIDVLIGAVRAGELDHMLEATRNERSQPTKAVKLSGRATA